MTSGEPGRHSCEAEENRVTQVLISHRFPDAFSFRNDFNYFSERFEIRTPGFAIARSSASFSSMVRGR